MTKRKASKVFPITAGVLGSFALAVSASGQFFNVTIEDYAAAGQPAGSETFRVVAHFGGADIVLAWGAIPGFGEMSFHTGLGVDLLNGGGPFSGLKAEDFAQSPLSMDWDSWVTVGTTGFAGNQTDYTPGFIGSDGVTNAIKGNAFSETDGLIFDSDPTSPIFGPDVVLAQFTIPKNHGFYIQGVIVWNPPSAGPGFNISLFATENFPAPGTLALFGLAGLVGSRRRRCE